MELGKQAPRPTGGEPAALAAHGGHASAMAPHMLTLQTIRHLFQPKALRTSNDGAHALDKVSCQPAHTGAGYDLGPEK